MNKITIIILLTLFSMGCQEEPGFKFPAQETSEGSYKDFHTTLEIGGNLDDFYDATGNARYTATDAARVAWAISQAVKDLGFDKVDEIQDYLANGYVFVTNDPMEYTSAYYAYTPGYDFDQMVAEEIFAGSAGFSWSVNDIFDVDGNFVIVCRTMDISDGLLVHEYTHVVATIEFGDGDSSHSDESLWSNMEGSLRNRTLQILEEN